MNFRRITVASLVAGLLLTSKAFAAPDVVVICNPATAVSSASPDDIARLFLGKTKALEGARLTPVDQSKDSEVAAAFYETVVGKSASQLRAYWSKLVFTGKGTPPKELGSDADVLAAVAADPNLVGYVSASAVNGSVKVLMKVE